MRERSGGTAAGQQRKGREESCVLHDCVCLYALDMYCAECVLVVQCAGLWIGAGWQKNGRDRYRFSGKHCW